MEPIKEESACYDQMAIVEKYEKVISYLYPIAQNLPRKHGVARDMFLAVLFGQTQLFISAGKSNQISKVYAADAGLATLRFWLRFLLAIRGLTPHQLQTSQVLVAEVGKMVGSWIIGLKRKGQTG